MKQKDILFILISTVVIVIVWIVFNFIHNFTTSTIPENLATQIIPIAPNFDIKTIEKLKTRRIISPLYEIGNQSSETATSSPSVTIVSSPSVTLTPNPATASEGGLLQ